VSRNGVDLFRTGHGIYDAIELPAHRSFDDPPGGSFRLHPCRVRSTEYGLDVCRRESVLRNVRRIPVRPDEPHEETVSQIEDSRSRAEDPESEGGRLVRTAGVITDDTANSARYGLKSRFGQIKESVAEKIRQATVADFRTGMDPTTVHIRRLMAEQKESRQEGPIRIGWGSHARMRRFAR
jgi:hypothetical protein